RFAARFGKPQFPQKLKGLKTLTILRLKSSQRTPRYRTKKNQKWLSLNTSIAVSAFLTPSPLNRNPPWTRALPPAARIRETKVKATRTKPRKKPNRSGINDIRVDDALLVDQFA